MKIFIIGYWYIVLEDLDIKSYPHFIIISFNGINRIGLKPFFDDSEDFFVKAM